MGDTPEATAAALAASTAAQAVALATAASANAMRLAENTAVLTERVTNLISNVKEARAEATAGRAAIDKVQALQVGASAQMELIHSKLIDHITEDEVVHKSVAQHLKEHGDAILKRAGTVSVFTGLDAWMVRLLAMAATVTGILKAVNVI